MSEGYFFLSWKRHTNKTCRHELATGISLCEIEWAKKIFYVSQRFCWSLCETHLGICPSGEWGLFSSENVDAITPNCGSDRFATSCEENDNPFSVYNVTTVWGMIFLAIFNVLSWWVRAIFSDEDFVVAKMVYCKNFVCNQPRNSSDNLLKGSYLVHCSTVRLRACIL